MNPGPAERAPTAPAPLAPGAPDRWAPVLILILAVTAARLAYLAFFCPYTLVEDEAHYWEWSRRLAWSYYSKGPGIAWTIAATDWLAARLGVPLGEFTVRAAAPAFGGLLALAGAGLTRSMQSFASRGATQSTTRNPRSAINTPLLAAALILLIPAYQVAALLMTIDGPYLACWGLAAWAGFNALHRGCGGAWIGLGAALAAGFLFKYTILLLPLGIALYAFFGRRFLRPHPRWPAYLALGAAAFAIGLAPVIIWNAQHGWPTVHHLLGHLGVRGGDTPVTQGGEKGWRFSVEWPLSFLGTQIAMVGPALVLMFGGTRLALAGGDDDGAPAARAPAAYCVLCAWPVLIFYTLVSFLTEPEGNWPLAGYITLIPLAAMTVGHAVGHRSAAGASRRWWLQRPRGGALLWLRISAIVGLLSGILMLRMDALQRSAPSRAVQRLLQSVRLIEKDRPLIPVGRLLAAREVARDAARVAAEIERDTGRKPLIIAQQYGRASQLAFYMPGRPTVYCSSAKSDGRRTQYDLWPDTDLDDPALRARPALCIGGQPYQWQPAFEALREIGQLRGEPKANRLSFIGYNYRGFPPPGTTEPLP